MTSSCSTCPHRQKWSPPCLWCKCGPRWSTSSNTRFPVSLCFPTIGRTTSARTKAVPGYRSVIEQRFGAASTIVANGSSLFPGSAGLNCCCNAFFWSGECRFSITGGMVRASLTVFAWLGEILFLVLMFLENVVEVRVAQSTGFGSGYSCSNGESLCFESLISCTVYCQFCCARMVWPPSRRI